jgi:AraC-like DNA-binding protein
MELPDTIVWRFPDIFMSNPPLTTSGALRMTSRTLRRHLEEEGTSFQAIVDDVRCSLAHEYLKSARMSTSDIAMLLGFSNGANFRRAFRRWTGKGVKQLREYLPLSDASIDLPLRAQ